MRGQQYNVNVPDFSRYDGGRYFRFDKNIYELCGEALGSGAHGVVYPFRAISIQDESQYKAFIVAVKYENRNSRGEYKQGSDFVREARHWCTVYSDGYVPAQASGVPDCTWFAHYLLMPFIRHNTFENILDKAFSIITIASYLIAIAVALDALHTKHRLVHGDLWNFNVMLDLDSNPKPTAYLIDFGETRSIDENVAVLLSRSEKQNNRVPFAPELYLDFSPRTNVLAKPSQDYYGFGFLIKTALEKIQKSPISDSELASKIARMSHVSDQLQMEIPSERWNLKKAIFMLDVLFISQPERPRNAQNAHLQALVDQCNILAHEIEKKSDATKSEKLKGLVFLYMVLTRQFSEPQQAVNETKALFPEITKGLFSRSEKVLDAVEKLPILPPAQPAVL